MSVFNRFFSFIFGCLLVVSGVVVFTDGIGLTYVLESVAQMWRGGAAGAITMLAGAVIFGVGLVVVLANLCIRAPKAVKVPGTEKNNAVYVTLSTIENMARSTALAVPGVVAVNTKIKSKSKGLCLRVRISVSFDDKINDVTGQLQADIRSLIEGSTALPVDSVEVLVVKASGEKNAAAYRDGNQARKEGPIKSDSHEATIPLDKGEES